MKYVLINTHKHYVSDIFDTPIQYKQGGKFTIATYDGNNISAGDTINNSESSDFKIKNGVLIVNKLIENKQNFIETEYIRLRQAEYPSLEEQADMQYWDSVNGTTIWLSTIQAVKDKYPKG